MTRDGEAAEENESESDPARFEEIVSALLKVDPTGIAGKHRRDEPEAVGEDEARE